MMPSFKCNSGSSSVPNFIFNKLLYNSYLCIMKLKIHFLFLALLFMSSTLIADIDSENYGYDAKYNFSENSHDQQAYTDHFNNAWQVNNDFHDFHQNTFKVKIQKFALYNAHKRKATFRINHYELKKLFLTTHANLLHEYLLAILFPFHYYW